LEFGWPLHVWLGADKTCAPQAGLDPPVVCLQDLRIEPQIDPERLLGAFFLGLDRLGRDSGVGREEAYRGGNDIVGGGIEDNARFISDSKLASVGSREKNGHVNVGQIDDRYDRLAARYRVPPSRQKILDLPILG
jgi:hypothetical protein